jgi:hypothetical protein
MSLTGLCLRNHGLPRPGFTPRGSLMGNSV